MSKPYPFLSIVGACMLLIFFCTSCKRESVREKVNDQVISTDYKIKYAKGFEIQYVKNYKKLIIKSPYQGSSENLTYFLYENSTEDLSGETSIRVPLQRIIATSTTHIPMLEALGAEKRLIGFPNTDFIASEKTRALIDDGSLQSIGKDMSLNTEMIIGLRPDAVIAFAMDGNDKGLTTIEKNQIPIVYNGDWLEETPLGRAEWIKFFGALLNMDKEADSIFNEIEREYLSAVKIAKKSKNSPKIMSGVLYKDQWNLPAGESFTGRLYRDANLDYIWKDSKGQGSLVLNFESVLDKAKEADFWIGSGIYTRRGDMLEANGHYAEFKAFNTNSVYTFSKRKGAKGGIVYFELGPLQPHVVLKDLIKVTHPDLLPGYEPFYLKRLD